MGVKCINTEKALDDKEPIFLYHNMVKMKKNSNPQT